MQIPAKPCPGGAARPAAARRSPIHQGHAFTFNSPSHAKALSGAPARERLGPKPGTGRAAAPHSPRRDGGTCEERPARRQLPRAAHSPPPLTGTRSFVGGLGSARLHFPAESHRALLRRHCGSARPLHARLPASATAAPAPSPTARAGRAPPAQGRAQGTGREGKEGPEKELGGLGSGGGVGAPAPFPPRRTTGCVSVVETFASGGCSRALLISGYVRNSELLS